MTARVFVPLVDARGEGAHLFEAIAGETAPEEHPARLVPQIAELFDYGLYGIGQSAREAVLSFVEARRRRLWLSPRNARLKPWHLRISDLQLGRLSDANARSAGLGLTLAALLQTFGRNPDLVFATGEIVPSTGPGVASARIDPVSGMRGKLALIGDYLSQHALALEGRSVVIALPALAEDGRPLAEAEHGFIARLTAEAEQARIKLSFVFADTLDALEEALGPFTVKELVNPRQALAAAAVVCAAALTFGLWSLLAHAPIRLAFEPPAPADAAGPDDAAPQRARYDAKSDKLKLLGPCFDAQREPMVVGGETLVLESSRRGRACRSPAACGRCGCSSPRCRAAPIRSCSTRRISARLDPAALRDPGEMVAAIPIEPINDEVRLFVLATRDPGLAISDVEAALRTTLCKA